MEHIIEVVERNIHEIKEVSEKCDCDIKILEIVNEQPYAVILCEKEFVADVLSDYILIGNRTATIVINVSRLKSCVTNGEKSEVSILLDDSRKIKINCNYVLQ